MSTLSPYAASPVSNSPDLNVVRLHWLDTHSPATPAGVRWGVPWPQGVVQPKANFVLLSAPDSEVPLQSWPLAYWPDGSLKWSGHAAVLGSTHEHLELRPHAVINQSAPAIATEDEHGVTVCTGVFTCRIPRGGDAFLRDLTRNNVVVAKEGRLVGQLKEQVLHHGRLLSAQQQFVSHIERVTLEQNGPVRAVVKVEGRHRVENSERKWLPFVLRLSFFAGLDTMHITHSFVFDGEAETDFISGLGVRFDVPLRDEVHNRHVRLAGENGLFGEPVRVIAGRRNPTPELYRQQIAGRPLPPLAELAGSEFVAQMAVWNDWKLVQLAADAFTITKRTAADCAWIQASAGTRALGTAFVGDSRGGLAVGMKNFWQLHPTALEVTSTAADASQLTLWLWSPDAPAMDLRHYSKSDHGLDASYEDIEAGFSTPHGVARTTEIIVRAFGEVPDNATLLDFARQCAQPPLLVCKPKYYHTVPVFGVWSLPDCSTPAKAVLERELERALEFYQRQIEQRRWYGFWDFGDVMHSQDAARHTWRYDIGGFAWANTELMPDLWLWYSFLRGGRADVFRMAEAMTRHTQEVDVHHIGPFAGLGSRHNVRHWGCSAKEVRISQSLLKRFYYYLTADERTGDLMNEVLDVDYKMVDVDPLRKIEPASEHPTHARVGPDWMALCSNWMTHWERTGETRYRDKMLVGMNCMATMPFGLFSGFSYGYHPESGRLVQLHEKAGVPHLAALMGGPELMLELTPLMNHAPWSEVWLHYCRYLQAPTEEQEKVLGRHIDEGRGPHYARMTAYAAHASGDATLARRAWEEFFRLNEWRPHSFEWQHVDTPDVPVPVDENQKMSTNDTAQWCLNAIQLLELVGDFLPAD